MKFVFKLRDIPLNAELRDNIIELGLTSNGDTICMHADMLKLYNTRARSLRTRQNSTEYNTALCMIESAFLLCNRTDLIAVDTENELISDPLSYAATSLRKLLTRYLPDVYIQLYSGEFYDNEDVVFISMEHEYFEVTPTNPLYTTLDYRLLEAATVWTVGNMSSIESTLNLDYLDTVKQIVSFTEKPGSIIDVIYPLWEKWELYNVTAENATALKLKQITLIKIFAALGTSRRIRISEDASRIYFLATSNDDYVSGLVNSSKYEQELFLTPLGLSPLLHANLYSGYKQSVLMEMVNATTVYELDMLSALLAVNVNALRQTSVLGTSLNELLGLLVRRSRSLSDPRIQTAKIMHLPNENIERALRIMSEQCSPALREHPTIVSLLSTFKPEDAGIWRGRINELLESIANGLSLEDIDFSPLFESKRVYRTSKSITRSTNYGIRIPTYRTNTHIFNMSTGSSVFPEGHDTIDDMILSVANLEADNCILLDTETLAEYTKNSVDLIDLINGVNSGENADGTAEEVVSQDEIERRSVEYYLKMKDPNVVSVTPMLNKPTVWRINFRSAGFVPKRYIYENRKEIHEIHNIRGFFRNDLHKHQIKTVSFAYRSATSSPTVYVYNQLGELVTTSNNRGSNMCLGEMNNNPDNRVGYTELMGALHCPNQHSNEYYGINHTSSVHGVMSTLVGKLYIDDIRSKLAASLDDDDDDCTIEDA